MGAAGSGGSEKLYVEDVFSTWLYTGNGSTQTITNGIDMSGKGGLVWIKGRSGATGHRFVDTVRGATKSLDSSSASPSAAEVTESTGVTSFSSTGFSIGADTDYNTNAATYASWTFRKAPKFFDVVTYTGNGANRTIAHGLGSVPGCIIVKRTDTTGNWQVYHRSLANTEYLVLNSTAPKATGATPWNSTTPTSTQFSLGTDATVNASGGSYVAYLFAHAAGGFGDSGNDNVISCGSYAGAPNGVITLGWEPQWILVKNVTSASFGGGGWVICDVSRGMSIVSGRALEPSSSTAEYDPGGSVAPIFIPTSNGFRLPQTENFFWNTTGDTFAYIAIRRGPMKTPTDATKVFNAVARTGTGVNTTVTCGFQADAFLVKNRTSSLTNHLIVPRLTGVNAPTTDTSSGETVLSTAFLQANPWDVMDGIKLGSTSTGTNASGSTFINYFFKRSPGYFDVATYTGTGAATTVPHNLGVVPELMLVKRRNTTGDWTVFAGVAGEYLVLNSTAAKVTSNTDRWNNTAPTSSVFTVGTNINVNASGGTYIAYLFASLTGVAKVGTYTGTAATLDVNCGFTNGARFVLIKRTDSTGAWYYWDTARAIIAGDDPYLLLNSGTTAEVTNTDYIDPLSSGFQISSTAPADINASGGTYLYLAIA